MPPPILTLRDARLTFGGEPLFRGVDLAAVRGDKICLVGRNGSGKSTLLKCIAGLVALDAGERFVQPGTRIAYLSQDPMPDGDTVAHYVAGGLEGVSGDGAAAAAELYRVDAVLAALRLDGAMATATLSGGEQRRAAIARALVGQPDVLLVDEPTNHLDLPTIRWLEAELAAFRGAVVVISHDRAFLEAVSRRTWWLDRGVVRTAEQGFARFDAWRDEVLDAEERELARMDTKLAQEIHWLHRGVTARRSRNMGRLRRLRALRSERRERARPATDMTLAAEAGTVSGKLVIEARDLSFSFDTPGGPRAIVSHFSTRIQRGDRVGLIGPNGAGKTTLLRLLLGELAPDAGTVRRGTNLETVVFDQHRTALDPEATVWKTLADGGDHIHVQGRPRHVMGYLKDFLFDQRQAFGPVRSLSGGERNRLLLAKLLARPANLLVLDEPTNDLDMETLDLLEDTLGEYDGTLILVSHDRSFLDRLVTSVIAVEGDGAVTEAVGGYSDYAAWRERIRAEGDTAAVGGSERRRPASGSAAPAAGERVKTRVRLSYKDQRALDELPGRMDALTTEIAALKAALADGAFYGRDPEGFTRAGARLAEAETDLAAVEERWLELEMLRESLASGSVS